MEPRRGGRPLYRPLNGEEIRLIELYPGNWNDPITCQLHYVPLDESPDFVALSYAWGDKSTLPEDISVNGRPRQVTQSLFTALRRLRSFGFTGDESGPAVYFKTNDFSQVPELQLNLGKFRLWADALCINQKNEKDKEHQIPLMGQIYRRAADVIVWLGENDPHDELLLRGLSIMLNEYDRAANLVGAKIDYLVKHRGLERYIEAAQRLLLRPWFTRLWVIQEIALPKRKPPFFFAGRSYYSLQSLISLSRSLEKYKGTELTPVLWIARLLLEKNSLVLFKTHHAWKVSSAEGGQGFDLSFMNDFSRLFLITQSLVNGFRASLPHDYIYAILGLCGPQTLPPTLAPNYSKPFAEVCRDYAMTIIEETGSLRVLARQMNSLDGVPSWVPDFSADNTDRWRPFLTKTQLDRTAKFSVDRSRMLIMACEVGRCTAICKLKDPGIDRTQVLHELRLFTMATAASSSLTYDNILKRLSIQCASAVWDYWGHQLRAQGICYRIVLAVSIAILSGSTWPTWLGDAQHFDFISRKIIDELTGAVPISTADGRLLFVHRKDASPRHLDILVVPVNSPFALLLRRQESNTYSLVSTCNLRQLDSGYYAGLILEDFANSQELKSFEII